MFFLLLLIFKYDLVNIIIFVIAKKKNFLNKQVYLPQLNIFTL